MGITTSSSATSKNQLTINDLDDDSLGMILNKLPYADRTRIESVCQRWYAVSKANWCTYSNKHLKIVKELLPLHHSNTENENLLEKILQGSGPYFEEITIERDIDLCSRFSKGTIKWIVEFCPKLKRLSTGLLTLNDDDWFACSNLEALSFICWEVELEGDWLSILFRNNKRLRRLELFHNLSLTASNFDHLDPGQLEFLQIEDCSRFEFTAELIDKLAESLVELRYSPFYSSKRSLQHLGKLKNLRFLVLKVAMKCLDTEFVADITRYYRKVECLFLAIWKYKHEQNDVFAPLCDLPYLRRLVILVDKNNVHLENQRDRLLQRTGHLEFFEIDTCAKCTNPPHFLFCDRHHRLRNW